MMNRFLKTSLLMVMGCTLTTGCTISTDSTDVKTSDAPFSRKFVFGPGPGERGFIKVTSDTMYTPELGYGFVNEKVKESSELLQIPELGSAFYINPSLAGQYITNILMEDRGGPDNLRRGFCYSDKPDVPLCFKVKVPGNSNYNVKLIMGDSNSDTTVTVFVERRRCVLRNATAKAGEFIECSFTANVCDIIPRGKKEVYHDDSLDIAVIGNKSCINALIIEEAANTPTIYIAGDSTLTDQSAQYPYNPATSYCGWAQILPQFLKQGIAVSNHAHSGLSTGSFKNGGHWEVVEKNIKPGDLFFIQFGHNDQKNPSLDAFGGYANNLRWFIDEVRRRRAYPVIITPVTRTTWHSDGTFNDMLADYAAACKQVAQEKNVPLIDLHAKSIEFVKRYGPDDSMKFFYPGDRTHHNDLGGFEMAKLVVEGIKEAGIKPVVDFLKEIDEESSQIMLINKPSQVVREDETPIQAAQAVEHFQVPEFSDITGHWAKADIEEMAGLGIIKADSDKFLPDNPITRVELLSMVLRALKIPPANVYNDMFNDVLGDEWFAGVVQSSYDNGLVDSNFTVGGTFKPDQPVTLGELSSIMVNAFRFKRNIPDGIEINVDKFNFNEVTSWAESYIKTAYKLGIIGRAADDGLHPESLITRAHAVSATAMLVKAIGSK